MDMNWKGVLSLALFTYLLLMGAGLAQPNLPGNGTTDNPYQISDCKDLNQTRHDLEGHYKLVKDINCSETRNWNNGKGFNPIGPLTGSTLFSGELDGSYYEITGLYINRSTDGDDGIALISSISDGLVKNLDMRDVNITGYEIVGSMVGMIYGGSSVINCSATGEIEAVNIAAGGIVGSGLTDGGNYGIRRSYFNGTVNCSERTGGILGQGDYGTVRDCYSRAHVIGGGYAVGGLVGLNDQGHGVHSSYVAGGVEGGEGLIGADPESTITTDDCSNSFWDVNVTGQNTTASYCTEGDKVTEKMKDIDTYTNLSTTGLEDDDVADPWDFVGNPRNDTADQDTWSMSEWDGTVQGSDYPVLRWEGNNKPPTIYSPAPEDNEEVEDGNQELSVSISDPDGDQLTVKFINASDNSTICLKNPVDSGTTVNCNWVGLESNESYQWYVNVSDGVNEVKSDTWNFTMVKSPVEVSTKPVSATALMPIVGVMIFVFALIYYLFSRA